MYVAIHHGITDPASFWEKAAQFELPAGMKLVYSLPNTEGTKGNCLWEAESIDAVRDFIEANLGDFSNNQYFEVDPNKSVGL